MKNYKKIIDEMLIELETEFTSKHTTFTKILNYEFIEGKLYGLYEQISRETTPEKFKQLYEYKSEKRHEIEKKYNFELINPIYNKINL